MLRMVTYALLVGVLLIACSTAALDQQETGSPAMPAVTVFKAPT